MDAIRETLIALLKDRIEYAIAHEDALYWLGLLRKLEEYDAE